MKLNIASWGDPASAKSAVLIHGVTSSAASWARVGPALAAEGVYVVAPELRGHGESAKADGHYSLDEMVADLPESVPQAPTLLLGHSFGGVMAILAIQRGLLTPGCLALEDPVLHFADKELPARLLKNDEANLPRDVEGTLRANPNWHEVDAEGKVASLRAIDWDHMRQVFSDNAPWDLRDAVPEIASRIPTLVILPETSFYVPPLDAAKLEAALGPGAIVHVAGTGHSIHRDNLDAFLSIIRALAEE